MRSRRWWKSLLVGLSMGSILVLRSGYVIQILDDGTTVPRWFTDDYLIEIQIWDGFSDQLPKITDGSNPKSAIKEALERWVRTTSLPYVLGEETSVDSVSGIDNIHLVTIADTPTNRNLFSGGTIGLSRKMFNPFSGRIIDVDLVLDPGSTWSTVESDDSNTKNVFNVTLHELGHHRNLDHSISLTSTMFFSGSGFRFDFNPLT